MIHQLFSVRDRAADQYGPVFQAVNTAVASRAMVQMMSKVPSYDRDSFQLVYIGDFDDQKGAVAPVIPPVVIDYSMPKLSDVEAREFDFGGHQ